MSVLLSADAPIEAWYCVRPKKMSKGWLAWGALQPLRGKDPVSEPVNPCYFTVGATEAECVNNLKLEMGKHQRH